MKIDDETREFLAKVEELSGQKILDCYQCGKCSAGCPNAVRMTILPNMIIRRLQLGQKELVLAEDAIWKCASCMTCWSRCPRKVNLCSIIEALRFLKMTEAKDQIAVEEIPTEIIEKCPQQALISLFRKYTY